MEENRKVSTCRCWKLGRHYTCLWVASRGHSSINTCSIKCIWLSVPRDIWQLTNMRQSLMKATRYTSHTSVSHETIIRDTTRSTRCSSFIISFLIFMCAYDGFVCVCVWVHCICAKAIVSCGGQRPTLGIRSCLLHCLSTMLSSAGLPDSYLCLPSYHMSTGIHAALCECWLGYLPLSLLHSPIHLSFNQTSAYLGIHHFHSFKI